jgi:asparagine synthase (glutamine-hydrolysing)
VCGVNGIFAYHEDAPPVDEAELLRTREHMAKRGPDSAGLWISADRRAGLAHRRLAIIDLSESGAQPMATADGRLRITYNGEIYNYQALRKGLEAKGYVFRSQSDTEVLLHLYADRGAEMVHALRGMFAFAIWDEREKSLFLARDPFGIKPLYYADDGKSFRFASQVKALVAGGAVGADIDPAGAVGFYVWGFVPEPFTICRGIQMLDAGSTLRIDRDARQGVRRYFSVREVLAEAKAEPSRTPAAMRERLREILSDSLAHHFVSDVPVAMFLSAGLDSTTLTALASESTGPPLHTLTLGFEEYRGTANDETPLAESVARKYGTRHQTAWIGRAEFDQDLEVLLSAMDQPSTDGVNTYFVSKTAAKAGIKVALSGLGGDELFAGYPSFAQVPRMRRWLGFARRMPSFGRLLRQATAPLLARFTSPKFASLLEYGGSDAGAYLLRRALYLPWELSSFLEGNAVTEGWERLQTIPALESCISGVRGDRARVAALELQWYMRNQLLRDADWAGMAHSVEIRLPLVDAALFREMAGFLVSESPPAKAAYATTPASPLPNGMLERSKTGFVVPVREWIAERSGETSAGRGLRGWARTVLPAQRGARILALVTDAFGGFGGIAQYDRDLLSAICAMPDVQAVDVVPRLMPRSSGALPTKLRLVKDALGGKWRFAWAALWEALRGRRVSLVLCGHINLLPVAWLCKLLARAPIVLCIYGIDAWTPPGSRLARWLARKIDAVISISRLTAERFSAWSGVPVQDISILPNAVHMDRFGIAPRNPALVERYGLAGKKVVATLGRLVSEERYKGFDEVLDILPDLVRRVPNLVYLLMGDGTDRARLEKRVGGAGLSSHVVFTGFVPEEEKADHLRLTDVYVMPSRGEGFGFVILEALACGVRAIGSKADGTQEALRDGLLGTLVDPDDRRDILEAIITALEDSEPRIPDGLNYYAYSEFLERVVDLLPRLAHWEFGGFAERPTACGG